MHGETHDSRHWSDETQPTRPYLFFIREQGLIQAFCDRSYVQRTGGWWIHQLLEREIAKDPSLVSLLGETFRTKITEIKPLLDTEPTLNLEELRAFTDKVRALWIWFADVWATIELFEIQGRTDRALADIQAARKFGENYVPGSDAIIRKSVEAIYPHLRRFRDVLLLEEILSGAFPSEETLQARATRYFYTDHQVFADVDLSHLEERYGIVLQRDRHDHVQELQGQVAYPGQVRGLVRIIVRRDDLSRFQPGEILVSPTTTPDFLPAIQKAAAIITNEGGIVCHAAIISRELKKPCVIGTKIATSALKDGDEVEVDAMSGVVKILKRAEVKIEREQQPLYVKWTSRDFCLPMIEIWIRSETTDPRQWTENANPKLPYMIMIRQETIVNDFSDETGVEWLKEEIRRMMERDPQFTAHVVEEFFKRLHPVKDIWEEQRMLNREELVDFIRRLRDGWAWFEAVWWIMDMADESSEDFQITKAARIATERMVPYSDILIKKSLQNIYPQFGAYADFLLIQEIESQLLPDKEELERRRIAYVFANGILYTGEGVEDAERRFGVRLEREADHPGDLKEFTGQVVCRGFARAKVCRVMSRDDLGRVEEGDILVCPMTMPDYLPAMRRASAFITDEGGITCHAAIVSREMGKPCIIGTKIATQVLKDGDEVEVDATSGVVKILKRAGV